MGPPKGLDMKGKGKRSIKPHDLSNQMGGGGSLRWEKQTQVEN